MNKYQQQSLEEGQQISQNQQQSDFITTKCAGRKQLCDVCQSSLKKYVCPKCLNKSCSILCINKHKKKNNCNGIADQFASLQKKQISQKQVQKDYIFVKNMLSNADKVKKTLSGVDSISQQPKRFKIMRINAKRMYNINLYHAPAIIERHRQNISFYFVKTKTFYWIIQLLYWIKDQKVDRHLLQPTSDSLSLLEMLPKDFLSRQLLENGINTQKKEQFSIFLQSKEKGVIKKYTKQFSHQTIIKNCFYNAHIYQYPTFVIVHNTLKEQYLQNRIVNNEKK